MTYLSRIRINPLRRKAQTLLRDPRAMRGAILHGVPGDPRGERILWRLDSDNPYRPAVFVLSRSKPDWSHLIESAGWPDAAGNHARVADYHRLLDRLHVGANFAFRITANPVQNTKNPDKPTPEQTAYTTGERRRSFRIGHRTADAQLTWFLARTEKWGFCIPDAGLGSPACSIEQPPPTKAAEQHRAPDLRIISRNRVAFDKKQSQKPITLHTATYEGRLEVLDAERLTTALLSGIGPAKAYGCGLLTLAVLGSS